MLSAARLILLCSKSLGLLAVLISAVEGLKTCLILTALLDGNPLLEYPVLYVVIGLSKTQVTILLADLLLFGDLYSNFEDGEPD